MSGDGQILAAAVAFLGTHFLLSHPLRAPIVRAVGAGPFLGIYSLVAFATLGWLAEAYRRSAPEPLWWTPGDALWAVASLVMLLASILFVGSLFGNPALPGAAPSTAPEPRGVFGITRHPMMWGFALWGLVHIAVMPTTANAILAGAIVLLALVGAALQDRKKARLEPAMWPAWEARTSYWPFARGLAWPNLTVAILGLILWLVATWAHIPLAGWAAGIWRWIS